MWCGWPGSPDQQTSSGRRLVAVQPFELLELLGAGLLKARLAAQLPQPGQALLRLLGPLLLVEALGIELLEGEETPAVGPRDDHVGAGQVEADPQLRAGEAVGLPDPAEGARRPA